MRVLERQQRKAGIKLLMVNLEHAHHRELSQPRHDTGRCHLPLRRDQHHLLARCRAQRPREIDAQHDAILARFQVLETAALHVPADVGDPVLLLRQDAAHDGPAYRRTVGQQALGADERRGGHHLLVARGPRRHVLPVGKRSTRAAQLNVRSDAEYPGSDLALEAVHDRQHGDQHRHAERDADHRHQRDKRNEMAAALGARVTHPDEELVRQADGPFLVARTWHALTAAILTQRG